MTIDWKKRAKEKLLANFFDTSEIECGLVEYLESTKELCQSTIPLFGRTVTRLGTHHFEKIRCIHTKRRQRQPSID